MKKAILFFTTLLALSTPTLHTTNTDTAPSTLYTESCEVFQVDGDIITVETSQGVLFTFFGSGYTESQMIDVVFDSMGTSSVNDDEIVNVNSWYCGEVAL